MGQTNHNSGEEDLLAQLQQEREKRQQAETRLREFLHGQAAPAAVGQASSLAEPDESISRRQVFHSLVSPLKPGKMLDLGSGPGTFSVTAARMGWQVTAVDARTVRTPDPDEQEDPKRAELIRSVDWVQGDIREFPIEDGEYDLICIFGLMHHLELDDQIKLLKRCSGTYTLLTVRVAPKAIDKEGSYEGAYRRERGETREERDQIPQASWGNEVDFIHTEESLMRLMRDCGYAKTMAMRPPHRDNYTFYLGLPSPKRRATETPSS
ncbi:MAG: class I SAM-dependent methyltransferase [Actinomycetota bacterium]|nr:class I SAM-dependent methyltransferase [Actinomycetota bacterium]